MTVATTESPLLRYPLAAHARASRKLRATLRKWHRQQFLKGAAALFDDLDRPESPRGVLAVCNSGFQQCTGWYAMLGREAAKQGIAPIFLMEVPPVRPYHRADLADLEGALVYQSRSLSFHRGRTDGRLRYAWTISPETGEIAADGINFFPVIRCMLRRDFRKYRIDFAQPEIGQYVRNLVVTADATLEICNALWTRFAQKGVPVRLIAAEPNYVPGGVFQTFCAVRGKDTNMEFLDMGNAYVRYFDLSEDPDNWVTIGNLTRHGILNRDEPIPTEFQAWLAEGLDGATALRSVQSAVQQNRTGRPMTPDALKLVERVRAHRAAGGRVGVIYGHLALDLGAFADSGPAHEDMVDWINHSISAIVGSDVLLLIKPHIAEVRHKANHKPAERMIDLITVPMPDNAIVLDPTWFNAYQLFDDMDFGLVWRSTVALELMMAGIPAIVACSSAPYWRCLDLPRFANREDYADLIRRVRRSDLSDGAAHRAALYLQFQREKKFIPFRHIVRHKDGVFKGSFSWAKNSLCKLRQGDESVLRLTRSVLEAG